MIFYFSGTGNSQFAARELAKTLSDEVVSINQCLKKGEKKRFRSDQPLVFVAPTYAWRMPKVVEQWIRQTHFQGNCEVYFVLTCAGDCGNAAACAKKLCAEKGLRFRGLASVIMPENYLAMFPTPQESECKAIVENAGPRIAAVAKQIQARECFPEPPQAFEAKLRSGPVHSLFYALCVRDKGFTVSNRCVSCGKCALRCPLNNVALVHGKPVWKGNCTHCMACIAGCPVEAIEYKAKSKGQHRHFIFQDSESR